MADIPDALRLALASRLAGAPAVALRASVEKLIEAYRSGRPASVPIMANSTDIAAYATYRMPATYAAVRAALSRAALAPARLVDIGGGTGAAAWAAVGAYPSITSVTVLDQVDAALEFGASLAASAPEPALRSATWAPLRLPGELPAADLITASYVMGELPPADAEAVLDAALAAARAVAIIEPGTPAGYSRIRAARARAIERGARIVAPCPHQAGCPITGDDWCHFAVRVNRSRLHRQVKAADLSYEDEKFSYLIAVRGEVSGGGGDAGRDGGGDAGAGAGGDGGRGDAGGAEDGFRPAGGRVLRRPQERKGMVRLRLCQPDGTIADRIVARSHGPDYRAARDASWGDAF